MRTFVAMAAPVAMVVLAALAGCTEAGTVQEADDQDEAPASPSAAGPVWGDASAPIRPGASLGGYCTFNFLFFDNVTGLAYIGTAGHCTEELGERVELAGSGEIGAVVFDSDLTDSFDGVDPAVDFSLILLDDGLAAQANPQMLGWDGPTGLVAPEDLAVADEVQLHGYGVVLGQNDVTRDRFGYLMDWDERLYRVNMPAVNGDSGSPLLHGPTGKAFGIVSHYGLGTVPPSTDEGPLMWFVMDQLAIAGFTDVALAAV